MALIELKNRIRAFSSNRIQFDSGTDVDEDEMIWRTLGAVDHHGGSRVQIRVDDGTIVKGSRNLVGKRVGDLKKAEEPEPKDADELPESAAHQGWKDIPNAIKEDKPAQTPREKLKGRIAKGAASATSKVADSVAERIASGQPFTFKQLNEDAKKHGMGSLAEGDTSSKDLYDAMELGVNRHILNDKSIDPNASTEDAEKIAEKLDAMAARLPTQTWRTEEQRKMQQFSTPPGYAYAAAWAANLKPFDTVLEPSAGNGSLAVHAMKSGAHTIANELSARRAGNLKELGVPQIHQEDAEQISKILHGKVKPSVVIMNPPFSQTAGRMGDKKVLATGANHIDEALKMIPENGRLVAIVGRGMDENSPTFRKWFKDLKEKYNLKANIEVSGDAYKKYGTHFGTRMLVIDKNGPTTENHVADKVDGAVGLIKSLEGVRNARPEISPGTTAGEPATNQSGVQGQAPAVATAPRPEDALSPPTGEMGAGRVRAGQERGSAIPAERPVGHNAPSGAEGSGRDVLPRAGGSGQSGGGTASDVPAGRGKRSAGGLGSRSDRDVAAQGITTEAVTPMEAMKARIRASTEVKEVADKPTPPGTLAPQPEEQPQPDPVSPGKTAELTNDVFDSYQPQHKLPVTGARKHPTKLVESAAMSAILPPKPTYKPNLPEHLIKSGAISDAQLEPIVYAGQAHNEMLPEVTDAKTGQPIQYRRGMFVGDGTGVGKGRIAAGIIHDNVNQGRKKAIWISKNFKLHQDALRDWTALGGDPKKLMRQDKVKLYNKGETGDKSPNGINAEDGVLFTGYGTLKTDMESSHSRIKQIADWVGPDFDGALVFDESHMMKGAMPVKGKRGTSKASKTAMAGIELQKLLPKARVVYLSATGATEVSNLGYAQRLGLWGPGTEFSSGEDFATEIGAGGVSGMELVAQGMKQQGSYMARQLSYDGVTQEPLTHNLSEDQRETYNKLAEGWQHTLKNINKALEITASSESGKIDGNAKSKAHSAFWGANQRFFNQVITSMQMPTVLKDIEQQLKEGKSAVLQLVNTNQASQDRALAKRRGEKKSDGTEPGEDDEELEDLDLTPRDQLLQMVEHSFPIHQHEEYADEEGNTRMRPVTDSKGNPVVNPQAMAMRDKLLGELASIKVPDGPLEMLHNHFGHEAVAEVTGRNRRVVRDPKTGKKIEQSWGQEKALADANAFQDGKKRILVFSSAGGTGASYHADVKAKNQQQRSHYLVQPGWVADNAVQGFGRTHRSGEVNQPVYKLVQTDLNGQKRFISSIARKLNQLGALTRGQRQAASQGMFTEMDNLESPHASDALTQLVGDISKDKIPGMTLDDFENQTGLKIRKEDKSGMKLETPAIPQFLNRLLSMNIDTQNKVFDEFMGRFKNKLDVAKATGALDTGLETIKADSIQKKAENVVYTDPKSGAQTKHMTFSVKRPIKRNQFSAEASRPGAKFVKNTETGEVFAVSPAGNRTDTTTGRIEEMYRRVGPGHNGISTKRAVDYSGKYEDLGSVEAEKVWNDQASKLPTHATEDMHLITGAILPIWKKIGGEPRVKRLQTDDGTKHLGRLVPESELQQTMSRLGVSLTSPKLSAGEAHHAVSGENKRIRLVDGWSVKPVTVAGERRVEVVGPDYRHIEQLRNAGAVVEKQGYQNRIFIPSGERGERAMSELLRMRPIESISGGQQSAGEYAAKAGIRFSADSMTGIQRLKARIQRNLHPAYA